MITPTTTPTTVPTLAPVLDLLGVGEGGAALVACSEPAFGCRAVLPGRVTTCVAPPTVITEGGRVVDWPGAVTVSGASVSMMGGP